MREYTYWLFLGDSLDPVQVSKQDYVVAERTCGFRNTMGQPDEPATSGFLGLDGTAGVMVYGDTAPLKRRSWSP